MMEAYRLGAPWALLGLLLVPALLLWRYRRGGTPVWLVPYAAAWMPVSHGPSTRWRMLAVYLAIALLVVAAARPQRVDTRQEVVTRGSELVLAVDLSTSMLAEDYAGPEGPINRLEAIRPVIQAFIQGRPNDRIAIVVFAGRAYTLAPLTTDHGWLEQRIAALQIGMLDDGTALGDALGIALTQLEGPRAGGARPPPAASEEAPGNAGAAFVVLLTDGANTSGTLTPPQATAIARHRGVPVYTIAAGRNGPVPFPVFDDAGQRTGTRQMPSSVDLEALQIMSAQTGGRHFAADDGAALEAAFADIDAAQKLEVQFRTELVVVELFAWAVVPALLLLLAALPLLRLGAGGPGALPKIRRGRVAGGSVRFAEAGSAGPQWPWRLALAALFALVALSRPQWGSIEQAAYEPGGEVVIALDLSRSMLAADLAPSRMDHARRVATALVEQLPDHRIGLIGFAGSATLLAPPSRDHALLRAYLASIAPSHLREQGTELAALLEIAPPAFTEEATARTLVVLSDGEFESAAWRERLPELRSGSIGVIGVGFGTTTGAPVPAEAGGWLRDSFWSFVQSRLDLESLRGLAEGTGGAVFEAAVTADLVDQLRQAVLAAEDSRSITVAAGSRPADRFPWFIALALLLLAWSVAREWPARARLDRVRADAATGGPPAARLLLGGVSMVLLAGTLDAQVLAPPRLAPPVSEQEKEAFAAIIEVVAGLVEQPAPSAADYLRLAQVSAEYGLVHRGHAHPISEGVLHDGLAAVQVGRQLDAAIGDWDGVEARLRRLLEPPPPVPEDAGEADPANEPLDARRDAPVPQESPAEGEQDTEQPGETIEQERLRNVGGTRSDLYDPAEWQDPTLVMPLHLLEQIRGTDSPAELFRATQAPAEPVTEPRRQLW
jgi:Ca-activated chloride channel homolog